MSLFNFLTRKIGDWEEKEAMTFLAESTFRIGFLNLLSMEPTIRYREIWNFEACYSHEHNGHVIRKHQFYFIFLLSARF